ncbi:MAG: ABC transporter substrate-binding protein [Sphingobacteriaceae bacterium]|nr:ABC transporter substrate-binding protein [Sphingobacteriaceae bacterium]
MKVISFLPAATKMIYDMGLQADLHGVTFECPAEASQLPKVVRCVLEDKNYTSLEIDQIFSASVAKGESLYWVDDKLLEEIQPDLIFTQDVCEVCQIDTACTQAALVNLPKQPLLVPLSPNNLEDVFACALIIAEAFGKKEVGIAYVAKLKAEVDVILDTLRANRAPLKRTMIMEWIEPIYNCGHWIPFQIAAAGGVDMLSNPAGDSIVTPWDKIVRYNPEVLVIAPCGFTKERTLEEMYLLTDKPEWKNLQAVQNNEVYIADFDMFTQPSIGTLVEGIKALAAMFHPSIFTPDECIISKFRKFN